MTKAKAADITALLINADYEPTIRQTSPGVFEVSVLASGPTGVLINTLKNFADTNLVTGRVRVVDFS